MPGSLAAFQNAFALALFAPDAEPGAPCVARLIEQPGFAVYRNTVMKGAIDALQANYPAVARLVGDAWFRAAAAIHVRAIPPARATLLYYGEDFAGFLASFEPARELPYLKDVARLDRFWTEAHAATSEPPLNDAGLTALLPDVLARAVLRPHASARWAWFEEAPIVTIWRRNRQPEEVPEVGGYDWRAEGVLIVRPYGSVETCVLDRAAVAFLDHCAAGATLTVTVAATLEADPRADLGKLMNRLLAAGAFSRLELSEADTESPA